MQRQTFFVETLGTPTGDMIIVTDPEQRLRAVDWQDHEHRMLALLIRYYGKDTVKLIKAPRPSEAKDALRAYFNGDIYAVTRLPVANNGTAFQQEVWEGLRRIPAGTTLSYGGLAAQIGKPAAMRAVGAANGSNPIAIAVPCHRVIGANGTLTGFGGGLERKKWLLAHEGILTA